MKFSALTISVAFIALSTQTPASAFSHCDTNCSNLRRWCTGGTAFCHSKYTRCLAACYAKPYRDPAPAWQQQFKRTQRPKYTIAPPNK